MNVSGTDLDFDINNFSTMNGAAIGRLGDDFILSGQYGIGYGGNHFFLRFDKQGRVVDASVGSQNDEFGLYVSYENYQYYPDNYFNLEIISLDEAAQRIKVNFSGKLYHESDDFNSEAIEINGTLDMDYAIDTESLPGIVYGDFALHCDAKFNGVPWKATHQSYPGSMMSSNFTAPDPYRIDIYFVPNNNISASYDVTPSSTDNYIKFWKFNTATLVYDSYEVTGTLEYHYREFHGANEYTYFGNFSFTAINPNNPADVIQVTDGDFISYQKH